MARVRSPNYPALSLPDAIQRVRDIHKQQQTTPEPRKVVVEHMGYGSMNGRALKSLSALLKYGLLDDVKDEGLKVSGRAMAILYPDPERPEAKLNALCEAGREPTLFSKIFNRWDGARPSEASLNHFLIQEGFNTNALDQVTRAFYETYDVVEPALEGYDSVDEESDLLDESNEDSDMAPAPHRSDPRETRSGASKVSAPATLTSNSTKPIFDFETVTIATTIDNQGDLTELIERLEKIKAMLPTKTQH